MQKHIRQFLFATVLALLSGQAIAQREEVPKGWHLLDKAKDGFSGISMEKAYEFVRSRKQKSQTVIVAVIDSGIDTLHEDLRSVLWKNPGEIPGNGKDDDRNGYIDDIVGWNFLGGADGRNVDKDSYEAARVYHQLKAKYGNGKIAEDSLSPEQRFEYQMWMRSKKEVAGDVNPFEAIQLRRMSKAMKSGDSLIRTDLKKDEYSCKDLTTYTSTNTAAQRMKDIMMSVCRGNDNEEITNQQLLDELDGELSKIEASEVAPPAYRNDIVKDRYDDISDRAYGNNDVMASNKSAMHGTHVSGIIGAVRGNGLGMDGVADNVRIMSLRAVPDGDEHDKDIALAIRYAVDNGARVINMSFGKSFSPQKKWVDEAVRYAESKDVLLVHAAGNDAKNLDTTFNYPCPELLDGGRPTNWITVGASGDEKAGGMTASFSNYGKEEVDVFAPGVRIYSTVPGGNTYQNQQGTSMASPVVAGLAAFIMSYYPNLTAAQVKSVIERSAQVPAEKVRNPGNEEMVPLSDLCRTGLINSYEAAKLAATITGERKPAPVKTKTSTPVKKGF